MPIELLEHPILLTILCITFLIALYMSLCFILSIFGIRSGLGCFSVEPPGTDGGARGYYPPDNPDGEGGGSLEFVHEQNNSTSNDEYENIVVKDVEYEYSDKPEEKGYYE